MTRRFLPPEVVSLIHHVELNESGWWKKSVGQVLRGMLVRIGGTVQPDELKRRFSDELGVAIPNEAFEGQLETLRSNRVVVQLPDGRLKLSEAALAESKSAQAAAEAEQELCKRRFLEDVAKTCPELSAEEVWQRFSADLASAIRLLGANMYHMLADGALEREPDWLNEFLSRFPRHQDGLREVLTRFFSPDNRECRSQVLRLMSAYFFAEASQLSLQTIESLEKRRKRRVLRLFLDTNYVFSLLGLHDNPADEAVASLLDITKDCSKFLDIKFQVLPHTLDEAHRSLLAQTRQLEGIKYSSVLYGAAHRAPLSSLAAKYFSAARKVPGLTPAQYFKPYLDDLKTVLASKGITVFEASAAIWNQNQDVVDDVLGEQEHERAYRPAKQKSYETLLHDAVLWHVVNSRRKSADSSPLDVEDWAITIDYRLIGFDQRKRSALHSPVPRVLHPANLLQLLQFWIPRSDALEASVVDSLRLPLYFQQFDPEDERATIRILTAVSRFENLDDLGEDTLGEILASQALRARITEGDVTNERVVELIREELIEENRRASQALAETKEQLATVARTAASAEEKARVEAARAEAEAREKERERAQREAAERDLAAKQRERDEVEQARAKEANANAELQKRIEQLERRQARAAFMRWSLLPPLVIAALTAVAVWQYAPLLWSSTPMPLLSRLFLTFTVGVTALGLGMLRPAAQALNRPELQGWWPAQLVIHAKKLCAAGVVSAGAAVYQAYATDAFKGLLP